MLGGWGVAEALPINSFGTPVTSITSSTGSVPNCPTLEGTTHAGVFGVTDVGSGRTAATFSDVGGGTENADALTMYLRFSPIAPEPLSLGTLRFDFISSYTGTGQNTPESMIATLTTETQPPSHHVPEPGTLGLVGAGLLVIAAVVRPRRRRGPRKGPSE
jgi:hypothetical protein